MKYFMNPGRHRESITFLDNIVYSHVKAPKKNCEMDLKLSYMAKFGNSEMRVLRGGEALPGEPIHVRPCIVWIPGGGWRGCDKNLMVPEMEFLAEAGFAVVSIYYRSNEEAFFPAQIIDVKSAIRFMRANAKKYSIDPDRIGVMGRSAGGHLASLAAMNTAGWDEGDHLEYSSEVQAAWDLFGPVDLLQCMKYNVELFKDPKFRWHSFDETHEGELLGATDEERWAAAPAASAVSYVSDKMAPILIMHGDADPVIPYAMSEAFYNQICEAGLEEQADFYLLHNGGHGSDEFFQPMTKDVALNFFNKYLK